MTYSPLGVPFKLSAQDMGVPDFDLFDALSRGQNFIQKNQLFPQQLQAAKLQNAIDQIKANYAQPMAAQDLIKAQLYNKYYGPDIQSQIGLRGNQGNLAAEEAKRLATLNPYLSQKSQVDIEKSQLENNLIRGILNQGNYTGNNENALGQSTPNLDQRMPNTNQSIPNSDQSNANMVSSYSNPNFSNYQKYRQASYISKLLGLGEPKIVDINGTQTAITPLGAIPLAQGLTPYQLEEQKGFGKAAANSYEENLKELKGFQNQDIALDNIIDSVQNNPEFRNVTGPVGSFLTTWAGNPAQRRLLGNLMSSSGEIALQIAPGLKGAFTGKDQTLINGIKANPSDFPDVFLGKLRAQKLVNSVLQDRVRKTSEYIEAGMTPIKAANRAVAETPLSNYKSRIDDLVYGGRKISIINKKTGEKKYVSVEEAKSKYGINI